MSPFTTRNGSEPEQRQRVEDAAAGFERHRPFVAVGDAHAVAAAIAERLANLRAEPGEIDHDVAHAGARQRLEVIAR